MRVAISCLVALLVACGLGGPQRGPVEPPAHPLRDPVFPYYPYCDGTTEVGIWAVDCLERCLPSAAPKMVCHSGGPPVPHFYTDTADARAPGPLVRAITDSPVGCPQGVPAWRIYRIAPEVSDWSDLDVIFGYSWVASSVSECEGGKADAASPTYFRDNWGDPYRYYYVTEEVYP